MRLTVNGDSYDVTPTHDDTPLLWVLRDYLDLLGTKYSCGIGQCGACTVHIDGDPVFSCRVRAADVQDRDIATIEGLRGEDGALHPLQQAWIDHDVAQCGYCQPGQIMQAAALLRRTPSPSNAEIEAAMAPILCRCGTYNRIREAIASVAEVSDE